MVVMVLDLMHVHSIHGQTIAGVKLFLLLELIIVLLCMVIIKKDILVFGEGPTQGLDDTTITAKAKYSINFTRAGRRFVLSLNYNGDHSLLFVNAVKMDQFKTKYLKKAISIMFR